MKKKILISDTAPLYPPLWGGPKRIWNLYSNFLEDAFDFTYVGVHFDFSRNGKYRLNRISDNFKEILVAFPPHYYPWHAFEKLFFKNTSLDLFVYLWIHTDWQFKYILNSQKADVIICSHPWSSLSLAKENGQFFIYDAHNCEYLLMDRILGKHFLKKLILNQVKKIESDACAKSDLILVCSESEKQDFLNLYKVDADKIIIVPNGANVVKKESREDKADYRKNLPIVAEDKVIVFIGTYYKPNIDALRFIIDKIAPVLKELKFIIVGTVSEAFDKKNLPANILFLGRVSDEQLDAVLSFSDIAINPMFSGSGINIKMLDYMSYGLPIVTTECGARGIDTFGRQPMIVSSIDSFIENINTLSTDNTLYRLMSEDGRSLIAEHYNWKLISNKLQDIILERLQYK